MICGIVHIFEEDYMLRFEGSELRAEAISNTGKGYMIYKLKLSVLQN